MCLCEMSEWITLAPYLTPFNSPVRSPFAGLLARSPLSTFYIIPRPSGSGGRLGAKNYTPVAITISPAAAAVFWWNCYCARNKGTVPPTVELIVLWYLCPMIQFSFF